MASTLYSRLGGYDGISAVCDDLLPRLQGCSQLGRFWAHRGKDGVRREQQLPINFLCAQAGGPMAYVGRDMKICHKGMRIDEQDWTIFIGHLISTLDSFKVPEPERADVLGFVQSLKADVLD